MVNIRNEAVVLSMDYVHNQIDYHDPVVQSDDPEDIPEFRNIFFTRYICDNPATTVRILPLDGYPDSIHDVYFKDCVLGK